MANLKDFEFDGASRDQDFDTGPVEPGGRKPRKGWIVALVVVLLGAGVTWWLMRDEASEPSSAPAASTEPAPRQEAEGESEEQPPLPELRASDPIVRQLVAGLSSHPRLAAWLATDDLVRRFTASIVNIWEGVTPRSHLGFLEPAQPFSTRTSNNRLHPSAKSYARYDAVADVVASLDPEGTVELYRRLEPLIDEAFADLGYPGKEFDEVLVAALDHLLAVPVLESDPDLVETVSAFEYADPELEGLSMAQKQLLRTGPENVRRIQETLRQLRNGLVATAD